MAHMLRLGTLTRDSIIEVDVTRCLTTYAESDMTLGLATLIILMIVVGNFVDSVA